MQRIQVHVVQLLDVHLALRARRQVDQGGLARAVARAVRDGDGTGARRDVEHAPAALLAELGQQQAHEVVRPVEVDGNVVDEVMGVLGVHLPLSANLCPN